MLNSFVHIHPELLSLLDDHTLITPNERLAREYRRAHQIHMYRQKKAKVWRAPQVFSLQQFVLSNHQLLSERQSGVPQLLAHTELVRYAHLALDHRPEEQSAAPFITNLLKNWETMLQYGIPLDTTLGDSVFTDWYTRFQDLIDRSAKIPALLAGKVLKDFEHVPPSPLVVTALDELTLPQRSYLAWLCEQHAVTKVGMIDGEVSLPVTTDSLTEANALKQITTSDAKLYSGLSFGDELSAAANYAKATKLANPEATIGIVVPNLEHNHHIVRRTMGSILDPENGSKSATFDLSGGNPLTHQPVWLHARKLIAAVIGPASYASYAEIWSSPFLALCQSTGDLDPWPKQLGRNCSLPALLRYRKTETAQQLIDSAFEMQKRQPLAELISNLLEFLRHAGWPNLANLDSTQYQAYQQIIDTLERLKTIPTNMPSNLDEILQIVDHLLAEATFSEQRPEADILVLGSLETTGLQFDHLWVCGMDGNTFPGLATRYSYIRSQTAERHGVPRASQTAEVEFAKRLLSRWSTQSTTLVLSYVARDGDADVAPSPLLFKLEPEELPPATISWQRQSIKLEPYLDDKAPVLTKVPERTGVRLMQSQAECAFKAFGEFRLGIRDEREPRLLVDPLGRGNLVHSMLYHLLRAHPNRDALDALTPSDIEIAINQSFNELGYPLPNAFVEHERARLKELCSSWIDVERARPNFEVAEVEQAHAVTISSLTIRLRIDRQDKVNDQTVVIDYKTGQASLAGLTEMPLTNVQLPLYAQIEPSLAVGVFYGLVHDSPRYNGLSGESVINAEATRHDWATLKQHWQEELLRIAAEFEQGNAAVNPHQPSVCRYCHLKSVCRVNAQYADETAET